jgi:benzoyl-CoA reductase/2-hydroxyglutaryl-CoA dehydratase subunit BcrC/BadD/HgdB
MKADYETRPFSDELWGRMKELRREHFRLTWEAQAAGGICAIGLAWEFHSLLAGFGKFANPSIGTAFTRISREGTSSEGLSKYVDMSTSKGLTPCCGAIGAHLGQLYAGISTTSPSGEKITPDFVFQPSGCHSMYKGAQVCGDILGIPVLMIDIPYKRTKNTRKYLLYQLVDAIEWIEKRTKKKFDDEKFIESTRYMIRSKVIWARICELMKTIPSPISYRQAMSLRLPLVSYAYSKKTMDYMEALYAEIQERVKDRISATPFEKKRLIHQGIHPLYRADVLRWPEEYGASFIQGNLVQAFGAWVITEDGHWIAANTLEERGLELTSREEALDAIVETYLPLGSLEVHEATIDSLYTLRMVQDWHADGVMLHLAHRCPVGTCGIFDVRSDLLEAGIPVGTYEASEADPNEFDEGRVKEDFQRFLEIIGLTKLKT